MASDIKAAPDGLAVGAVVCRRRRDRRATHGTVFQLDSRYAYVLWHDSAYRSPQRILASALRVVQQTGDIVTET
jgi:hypothetical protein